MQHIILLTKNNFKIKEITELLSGNNLRLSIMDRDFKTNEDYISAAKENSTNDCVFIREQTVLLKRDTNEKAKIEHLESVSHKSVLKAVFVKEGLIEKKEYQVEVNGFLDFNKKRNGEDFYNWDNIFVSLTTMESYLLSNRKFSARSIVVSEFLEDNINFKNKKDLNFNAFNQDSVIDFSGKIYNLIENNKIIKKHKNSEILNKLINKVKKNGLFTRSSINKKQRNYWFPALNAGLPLVSKKDEIHEVTFMFHDLMHHLIPDLIYTGNTTYLHKEAYVIHRMLSEAFTIVLADMIFVDELNKSGEKYDFNKRKIYPLYQSMDVKKLTLNKLKEIIWANIKFALLEDASLLRELAGEEEVEEYVGKYAVFFKEDYVWTKANYDNMDKNNKVMTLWFEEVRERVSYKNTVDYYMSLINVEQSYEDKVLTIFNEVWKVIELAMKEEDDFNKEKSISDAFKRYMVGQSILFTRHGFKKETGIFKKLIKEELNKDILSQDDIKRIRAFFNLYVDKLVESNLLTINEAKTYKEVVPLFEAFYVFY